MQQSQNLRYIHAGILNWIVARCPVYCMLTCSLLSSLIKFFAKVLKSRVGLVRTGDIDRNGKKKVCNMPIETDFFESQSILILL